MEQAKLVSLNEGLERLRIKRGHQIVYYYFNNIEKPVKFYPMQSNHSVDFEQYS